MLPFNGTYAMYKVVKINTNSTYKSAVNKKHCPLEIIDVNSSRFRIYNKTQTNILYPIKEIYKNENVGMVSNITVNYWIVWLKITTKTIKTLF